jgi:esterase/lipase superfamily enzyme
MHREIHRWRSPNLEREMGMVVYGHWGAPLLVFPTSGGDEWEQEQQGMIGALAEFIDGGRLKVFTVNSVAREGFLNRWAHPLHRSYMQRRYGDYVRQEAIPFVQHHCRTAHIGVMGASMGAYLAANVTFKYPDVVKRCFALSGVYDLRRFMDGQYDDNFYFNNPVDYLPNLTDGWHLGNLATCDIHIVTGHGPWEDPAPSYRLSGILASKEIPHSLDDWGPEGGHDWPYWKRQMREYVGKLF